MNNIQNANNDGKYTKSCFVTTYDADKNRELKLSAFMRYAQETGEEQLRPVGLGYEELYNKGVIFVMTRCAIWVHKPILLAEPFAITTWHRGSRGVQLFREYRAIDENGNVLIEAATSWVMLAPDTHKILRANAIDIPVPAVAEEGKAAALIMGKEQVPADMDFAGERPVQYSDLDYNNHLNNAVYLDIARDFCPVDMDKVPLQSVRIHYIKENREGHVLKVQTKQEGSRVYLAADNQDGRSFEALIDYKKSM